MRIRDIIALAAVGMSMAMCTVQRPVERSFPTPEPPVRPVKVVPPGRPDGNGAANGGEGAAHGYDSAANIYDGLATGADAYGPAYYYIEGLKASQVREDVAAAAEFFDMAIREDSTHAPSYYAAANNIAMSDPGLALRYSRRANRLDPDNEWYRTQLAMLYMMNRRYDDAFDVYEQLLLTSPENPENYHRLAALYEVKRLPFAAVAMLDSAERRFGRMEELTEYKRELYLKLNMADQAIRESLAMIDDYPYNYRNYLIAGDLYRLKGMDSLARSYLEKAAAMNPDGPDVLLSMAGYYRTVRDDANFFAAAKKIAKHKDIDAEMKVSMFREITNDMQFYSENYFPVSELALALRVEYPDDYDILGLYASTFFAAGETDAGLNLYKNYICDTTSFADPYVFILEGEAFLGRIDSVNKYSLMAIERFPDDADLYLRRGSALLYMERPKDALDVYSKALKLVATDSLRAAVHASIGDVYHSMDKDRQAFANYEKALRYDPDNVLALNNYAYFLSLTGKNLDKALSMASRVMELEPGNSTYIDTYGWVLYKLGRYADAKKALQQAVSLDPTASKELLAHYGDVLYELGDHFMARFYWQKALAAGYDEDEIGERMKKTEE